MDRLIERMNYSRKAAEQELIMEKIAMRGFITNFKDVWKRPLQQNGQGLTEFVIILAFCAIIGWFASKVGFLDAIGAVFDSGKRPEYVTASIGGGGSPGGNPSGDTPGGDTPGGDTPGGDTPTDPPGPINYTGFDWGTIVSNEYFKKSYKNGNASLDGGATTVDFTVDGAREDRLASDQTALANIALFFMDKTQAEVIALLKGNANNTADMGKSGINEELLLCHIYPKNGKNPGMTTGESKLTNPTAIFQWMKNPSDPDSVVYDPNYNYLVSDYVVSQGWVDDTTQGSLQKCGIKLRLEYDYSGQYAPPGGYTSAGEVKVIGAHVMIDPRSQNNQVLGNGIYNTESSTGLDVNVRKDANGNPYITVKDTGVPVVTGNESGLGTYNWYGEGDFRLVKEYIASKAITIDNVTSETKAFEKGQIIYVPGTKSYYIALKDGTQSISNTKVPEYAPNNNNVLVKFETADYRYWHENDKTDFNDNTHSYVPKYIKGRGTVYTMDNGDIYVYVGDRTSNSNNIPFEGFNDDWIQIRGQS